MPKGYLNSDEFLNAVKRQASVPANQSTFTDQDILDIASLEMKIGLVPSIMSVNEEYYVYPEKTSIVSNKSEYGIPYRAVGGKLRDVAFVDNNDNIITLNRISPNDKDIFQKQYVSYNLYYFYLQNNSVILTPPVTANPPVGSLLFTYYMRPNDLVMMNQAAFITDIIVDANAGTTSYSVSAIPSGFSTSTLFDVLQANPGHKTLAWDRTAVSVNTNNNTIVFNTSDVNSSTIIGDYICFAGQCVIPQAPSELHTVLVQRTVSRIMESIGDTQGLNNSNTKVQEMETKTFPIIDNRTEGAAEKVANQRGLLRSSKLRRRYYW